MDQNFYDQLDALKAAKSSAYEFIQVCHAKGLVTFEAAKKAQDSVHKDFIRDLSKLKRQFMNDRKLESQNIN